MKFSSKITLLKLSRRHFKNALHKHLTDTTKEAARSWLRTVTVIVPVWSQASRATFVDLADAVGFTVPMPGKVIGAPGREGLGRQYSSGGLRISRGKSYLFYYETDLRWLVWNNFNHAVQGDGSGVLGQLAKPGPYRFEVAGKADFESFAATVKLPNPWDYVNRKRI